MKYAIALETNWCEFLFWDKNIRQWIGEIKLTACFDTFDEAQSEHLVIKKGEKVTVIKITI